MGEKKKKKRLKNEMKCSHSSTLVPNVARLVGLRSWKGSSKKKPHIAVNVSKRDWTHTQSLYSGDQTQVHEKKNPKSVGWGVRGQSEEEKREKTFQKDHHRLHTDRHGLPSDRLCYSEMGEVGDEEGMERVWKKRKEYIWKYIFKTYGKICKI